MRSCRCACGALVTMPDLMDLWDAPMLAHVRGTMHQAWRQTTPAHVYEEHLDTLLLADAATSGTRGTAGDPGSAYTSTKAV